MGDFLEMLALHKASEEELVVDDETFIYWIIRSELEPGLPCFVGVFENQLFISEDVLEEDREHYIWHEVMCNIKRKGQKGRCLQILEEELSRVPEFMREGYIQRRLKFFEDLVRYSQNSEDEEFKAEIMGSLMFLKRLIPDDPDVARLKMARMSRFGVQAHNRLSPMVEEQLRIEETDSSQ